MIHHQANPPGKKTLLLTIGTIGSGKTTTSLTLKQLYSFGHIQNDNITTKKPFQKFIQNILQEFQSNQVVIADKNNHLPTHREKLLSQVKKVHPDCQFIVLYWNPKVHDIKKVFEVTKRRIEARGENHQSLTPNRTKHYEAVMYEFLNSFTPIDLSSDSDRLIDHVIDLNPLNDTLTNVNKAINELTGLLNLPKPSDQEIEQALQLAFNYKPNVTKVVHSKVFKMKSFFFAVRPSSSVYHLLRDFFDENPDCDRSYFDLLVEKNRLGPKSLHHVTLVHSSTLHLPEHKALHDQYASMLERREKDLSVEISFDYLVWSSQVVCLRASELSKDWAVSTNRFPHITVATLDHHVKPILANQLLEAMFDSDTGEIRQDRPEDSHYIRLVKPIKTVGSLQRISYGKN